MDKKTSVPSHSLNESDDSADVQENVPDDVVVSDESDVIDGAASHDSAHDGDSDTVEDPDVPIEGTSDEPAEKSKKKRPRHVVILRFIVAPILVVAAVVCAVFSILAATSWRPDPTARASADTSTRYIVTDPGVLSLANENVSIAVTSDSQVCMAVGSSQDVAGWIASHQYTRVKGLTTWSKLSASKETAAADTSSAAGTDSADSADNETLALKDSDMWLQTKCGTGTVNMTWKSTSTNQALIVDTNPEAAESDTSGVQARLALTWVRTQVLDLSTPLAFLAALLLLGAVLSATLFAMAPELRRKRRAEKEAELAEEHGEERVGEMGQDSPRWVHDHAELAHRKARTTHRRTQKRKRSLFRHSAANHGDVTRDSAAEGGNALSSGSPAIVDVKSVNMVARQQEASTNENDDGSASDSDLAAPSSEEGSATGAISSGELADYFARLADERLGDEDDADNGTDSGAHDDNHDDDEETHDND